MHKYIHIHTSNVGVAHDVADLQNFAAVKNKWRANQTLLYIHIHTYMRTYIFLKNCYLMVYVGKKLPLAERSEPLQLKYTARLYTHIHTYIHTYHSGLFSDSNYYLSGTTEEGAASNRG